MISVNLLIIYGAIADLCKELNEDSAEDSSEDSESSGTFDEQIPRSVGKARYRRKRSHAFSIASLFERHDFSATRAERLQNAKHWILRLNADGPQKPLRQRPEFAVALEQCRKMQDARLAETRQPLRPIRPERQRQDQQFEGKENFDYCVDRKTGWRYYRELRGKPPAASSTSTSLWQTSQWQTSWSSWLSTSSEKWWWFRFPWRSSRKLTGV